MNVSSTLVLLGLAVLVSLAVAMPGAYAVTEAKTTAFEKTTIIEFTNNDSIEINTVRIWLGNDAGDFMSFKTERGWTGTKAADGLLIFTATQPLKPGDSVKFGIKTAVANPGINWRTADVNGNELATGKTGTNNASQTRQEENPVPAQTGIMENAKFRIIPENPKNGDDVRIVGDGFVANTRLDFLINGEKLETFNVDGSGNILGRAKIPTNAQDRVEFELRDNIGNKKTFSIRIVPVENTAPPLDMQHLIIDRATDTIGPGETAYISGTARPGTTVSITARDMAGNKIYEVAVPVSSQGIWTHETVIPPNAEIGPRNIEITNGQDTITRTLNIQVTKTIQISSTMARYEPGDKMIFNGTVAPGQPVEVIIKDPIGEEVFSEFWTVAPEVLNFDYQTLQTSRKGTYVVLATQGSDTDIVRVGLGEAPSGQIVAKLDKLNYTPSEKAKLTIQGPVRASISLLIIDPSVKEKPGTAATIALGADGKKTHEIDLNGYKSGIYTVQLRHMGSQITDRFGVGLQYGSGQIQMQTTKQTYLLGEGVRIIGKTTNPNVLLKIEMFDPDKSLTKVKNIFTDKEGRFYEITFRVPADATQGTWVLRASSGTSFSEAKIEVVGTISQAFVINIDNSTSYKSGDILTIKGNGGGKEQTVTVIMYDSNGERVTIWDRLEGRSTNIGSFEIHGKIPANITPGTYKAEAKIGNMVASTTFTIGI